MKKLLLALVLFLFTLPIFSQTIAKLEEVITYYGYEVEIEVGEGIGNNWFDRYMIVETTDNDYSEYEHLTFIIATSRAIIKYVDSYVFDLYDFELIIFESGNFISELSVDDLFIAAEYDNRRLQQEYLSGQRSAK